MPTKISMKNIEKKNFTAVHLLVVSYALFRCNIYTNLTFVLLPYASCSLCLCETYC